MKSKQAAPKNIDEYIAGFPDHVQAMLARIRATIQEAAPGAEEAIKYGIPTFVLKGNLVHFGAYHKHIGFYPSSTGIAQFKKDLSGLEVSKGTVQFPLDKPMPRSLVTRIVKFRVKEQMDKAKAKGSK